MFYGFAWMATAAVITIFFEKVLHLNYSSIAFYKNAYNTLAILLLPYFGKLIGKIDPRKFAVYTFGFMLLHSALIQADVILTRFYFSQGVLMSKILAIDDKPDKVMGGNGTDGFGLFGIRERLSQLGGSLEIDSSPGQGCRSLLHAPLQQS